MTSFHPYLFKHQLPLVNAIVFDKHILPKVQYLIKYNMARKDTFCLCISDEDI